MLSTLDSAACALTAMHRAVVSSASVAPQCFKLLVIAISPLGRDGDGGSVCANGRVKIYQSICHRRRVISYTIATLVRAVYPPDSGYPKCCNNCSEVGSGWCNEASA